MFVSVSIIKLGQGEGVEGNTSTRVTGSVGRVQYRVFWATAYT